jgi:WD40 repeat protein
MAIDSQGKYLAVATTKNGGEVHLLEMPTGKFIRKMGNKAIIATRADGLAFSADGSRLAAGGNPAVVWNVQSGNRISEMHVPFGKRYALPRLNRDGSRLIASGDEAIVICDVLTGTRVLTLRGQNRFVSVSSDGERLASSTADGSIRLWDARLSSEVFTLRLKNGDSLLHTALNADGTLVAVCGRGDRTVTVWNTETGEEVLTLQHDLENVWLNLVFDREGKRLLGGGGANSTVELTWSLVSGQLLEGEPRPVELVDPRPKSPRGGVTLQQPNLVRPWEVVRQRAPGHSFDPWVRDSARRGSFAAYWHARDAKASEHGSDWFAAVFHLDCLLHLMPSDPGLLDRRKTAAAHLAPEILSVLDRMREMRSHKP